MSNPTYDLVIRGGTVGTSSDVFVADVGITGEAIVAVGRDLAPGKNEIDASGKFVLPGGVDAHAHIEQLSAAGIMNADTFESATRSAAFGGTTSVISFAAQHVGMDARQVVTDYTALAKRGAVIDYAFHLIVADVTEKVIVEDIPALVGEGFSSIKIFMTYDRLRVEDEKLLDILAPRAPRERWCASMRKTTASSPGWLSACSSEATPRRNSMPSAMPGCRSRRLSRG